MEPRIRSASGVLKISDLILQKGNLTLMVDVRISWEGPNNLSIAGRNKVATYSDPEFIKAIQQRYPDSNISVVPLGRKDIGELMSKTMIGSLVIHTYHMKNRVKAERILTCVFVITNIYFIYNVCNVSINLFLYIHQSRVYFYLYYFMVIYTFMLNFIYTTMARIELVSGVC